MHDLNSLSFIHSFIFCVTLNESNKNMVCKVSQFLSKQVIIIDFKLALGSNCNLSSQTCYGDSAENS